jgi:hypothetical protein
MPVAEAQLHNEGLAEDAHRVTLAGAIGGLQYPPLCPNCGAAAADKLPIAKVFMHNRGGSDEQGWRYRIVEATPLFCRPCLDRHRAETVPVTELDRVKSVVFSELAVPGIGTAAFAVFLLVDTRSRLMRDLAREWPILAFIGGLLLIAALCFRTAWENNAHRRVPRQTSASQAFDFGDNDDSPFQTTARTYAVRNDTYAEAFGRLNAEASGNLLGPSQRRRESRSFWVTAAIIAALALGAHFLKLV